ncbi:hypothetical protein [Streptomyces milbemycinicus]|uniref:hypothetical protein n=1 Tax=Streptomyces milbemycinicus TaxID=476552 RepID=UPI00117F1EA6|nr:hypothetical protein [Streptomyces milbemycinicus]
MPQGTDARPDNPPGATNEQTSAPHALSEKARARLLGIAGVLRDSDPEQAITDSGLFALAERAAAEDLAAIARQIDQRQMDAIAEHSSAEDLTEIAEQVGAEELEEIAKQAPAAPDPVAEVLGLLPPAEPDETRGSYGTRLWEAWAR